MTVRRLPDFIFPAGSSRGDFSPIGSLGIIAPEFAPSREVQLHFVNVAPAPGLAWLDGFHDGVLGVMEMLGGMFIFR